MDEADVEFVILCKRFGYRKVNVECCTYFQINI